MTLSHSSIAERLATVRERISRAEIESARAPGSVRLIGISKTKPASTIRDAVAAGLCDIGENYLQEALEKQPQLSDLAICWHFVGKIQSNKTAAIAGAFDWVHGVDRLKIARRLNEQRPPERGPLNCCIEVNLSGERSKGGVEPGELLELASAMREMDNIRLRGLMGLPAPSVDPADQRIPFSRLASALLDLQAHFPEMDTLSMGMTDDLEVAIAEGATMVRIGTAIFGSRTSGPQSQESQ